MLALPIGSEVEVFVVVEGLVRLLMGRGSPSNGKYFATRATSDLIVSSSIEVRGKGTRRIAVNANK